MSEFDTEPYPGLPEELPDGEQLLWQGAPDWKALARSALHVGAAGFYILLAAGWSLALELQRGEPLAAAAQPALRVVLAGALGIALLALIAWLIARTTIYSITSRRIVMRFGVAMPMAVNIPYSRIVSADVKLGADRSGDIAIRPSAQTRLGFVPLWPHVRAWRLRNPEPVLRCLPDAQVPAELLARALAAEHGKVPVQVKAPSFAVSGQASGQRSKLHSGGATTAAA